MEKEWALLTPEEKREKRFERWLKMPDIEFDSPEAKANYGIRLKRLADAYRMRQPDRVPVMMPFGDLPLKWENVSLKKAMYDYDLLRQIWSRFLKEYEMDTYSGPGMVLPGRVYDLTDYRLYIWPGHGLPDNAPAFQFVEGEYMKADEYGQLLRDPSDFWFRVYLPRIFGVFEAFEKVRPFTSIIELPAGYFGPYSRPEVQAALQAMIDAGKEMAKYQEVIGECVREAARAGVPSPASGGLAKAPFDTIGDTLRGTRGISFDMYRQPDVLHEAMDKIADITIANAIEMADLTGAVSVGFPLHKGADGFMSRKQFETFYWPSLKKVMQALIDEGLMPSMFAEGSYLERLEAINEFPKGSVIWRFDKTDMAEAKKVLGDKCCISGNVPASLISTGTPQEIKEYCRKLIEVCAPGGGYVLSSGSSVDSAPPENVRAIMEAVREYGVYR